MPMPIIEQSPGIARLVITPGNDASYAITLTDSLGAPIDVTPYTFQAGITSDDINIFAMTITIVNAVLGQISMSITAAISDQVIDGSKWFLNMTNISTSKVRTLMLGPVVIQQI